MPTTVPSSQAIFICCCKLTLLDQMPLCASILRKHVWQSCGCWHKAVSIYQMQSSISPHSHYILRTPPGSCCCCKLLSFHSALIGLASQVLHTHTTLRSNYHYTTVFEQKDNYFWCSLNAPATSKGLGLHSTLCNRHLRVILLLCENFLFTFYY